MRYLLFIFLIFFSGFSFSQNHFVPKPEQGCAQKNSYSGATPIFNSTYNQYKSACLSSATVNLIDEITYNNGTQDIKSIKCYGCAVPCLPPQIHDPVTKTCKAPPPDPTENGENCPSGYPKVNGECPVCPSGFNPDGTCVGSSCPDGQITQGYINGYAVCQGQCSDPAQSWGSVNGVEGCYGACTCSNGGSYGTVNGIPGCYGGNGSGAAACGSGGSNSSGGASGSSGSNTSGSNTSGGSSGSNTSGSNTSSGSGANGGSGGGNGGSGGGSNNSGGADYPEQVACPEGYIKSGTKCVTENKGDCPANYHQLVISRDPFLFWCVPDDPPQSSSASSQQSSSQASSQSQSSKSSQNNSSVTSGSSGSGSSSGNGNGGGWGDGEGVGECDPTSSDYLTCIAGNAKEFVEAQKGSFDAELAKQEQQQLEQQIKQKITDIKSQITEQMGGRISGSGSITDYCKIINGIDVCFGFAKFSAYLPLIGQAIFLVACVFSFYVILGR